MTIPCIFRANLSTMSIVDLAGVGGGGANATRLVCTSHHVSCFSSSSSESHGGAATFAQAE
jgi:hypothetical protein